ncbi:MAG: Asp-tRNA(Asn)/Glu-tRNA(Gln) amidotransferase subunit GatB [Myxococcota bacterium]|nr:Asp-tRNA(Asn)/Glu-tRNA(Gln) amidotransferase subunit GatB [Myxococcota bacterium]
MANHWETVIGLEVHAQLSTKSKLFSSSGTTFGRAPNTLVDVVNLGLPGVLPVLNKEAVKMAIQAGIGLNCTIHPQSQFDRKHYFYPDLPKGYQITQFAQPYATAGYLDIAIGGSETKRIRINRIHMEEDAGKNVHDSCALGSRSVIDFNRAGTPLIEIVSEPDLSSSQEVVSYLKSLRQILRYLGVCDGNMQEGSFRCDVNISVRKHGKKELGTRTELKNINSFKFIQQATEYEVERQIYLLEAKEVIVQETRLWDSTKQQTRSMRSKEDAHDYRYFPDPDLPILNVSLEQIENLRNNLPELPNKKKERFLSDFKLSEYDATVLTEEPEVATFFEEILNHHRNPKLAANWLMNELLRDAKETPLHQLKFGAKELAELLALIDSEVISGKIGKEVLGILKEEGGSPNRIVESRGLKQVANSDELKPILEEIIARHPQQASDYRGGKTKLIGFFVGQIMKETQGKANPKLVNKILKELLG